MQMRLRWAAARDETRSTATNALVQFQMIGAGHNLELFGAEYATMEGWLDAVLG